MKTGIIFGAAVAALWLAGSAAAQPASPAPDPVRLQLARQIIEASGGVDATRARMAALFGSMHQMINNITPQDTGKGSDASKVTDDMFKYIADEEVKAVPQLLDQTAEVYAEHLTEPELRAMLAWASSPESKSIQKKLPEITQEILLRQQPMMKQMMTGIFQRAADRACADNKCTPDQEKRLVAMMNQFAGGGGQGAPAAKASN
jgi:hypothetical protein